MKLRHILLTLLLTTSATAFAQVDVVPTALEPITKQEVMTAFWEEVNLRQRARGVPPADARSSKAILDCLNFSKSNLGYFLLNNGGSVTFLTVGAFSKNQQFAVVSSWMLALPVEHEGTTYFVGVATNVTAKCQSSEKSIKVNGLFGVAAGVEQKKVQGSLEVITQGLAGKAVADNTKAFQQITEDTLFTVTENVAVLKAKLYDEKEVTVQPTIVGVMPKRHLFSPLANHELLNDLKIDEGTAFKVDLMKIKGGL
jgi:hypothetical protein